MATREGLSYYFANFEYSMTPGQEGSQVNLKYDFLINTIDVKRRYHNYFLREDLDTDKIRERGDKGLFSATLRPSFDCCWDMINGTKSTEQERYLYEGSTQIIDGMRYDYRVNIDETRYRLVTRKIEVETCDSFNSLGCHSKVVDVKAGKRHPCDGKEMMRGILPGGNYVNQASLTFKNVTNDDGTVSGYITSTGNLIDLGTGLFLSLGEVLNGSSVESGQVFEIVGTDSNGWLLDKEVLGLSGDQTSSVQTVVYESTRTAPMYITEDGIVYYDSQRQQENLLYKRKNYKVHELSSIAGGAKGEMLFIENRKLKILPLMSAFEYEKTEFNIGSDLDVILRVNQYFVLMGKENLSIAYYISKNSSDQLLLDISHNVAGFGYFNKGSYVYNNTDGFARGADQFVMVNSRGLMRNYEIQAHNDYVSQIHFSLNRSNMGNNYINTDLRSCKRKNGDKIYLSSDAEFFFTFLVNKKGDKIKTTGILKYIQHYRHYMKRMIEDEDIVVLGQRDYSFFGNADYQRGRNTYDTNREGEKTWIRQGFGLTFGDLTESSPKALYAIDISVGEDTHLSGGNHQLIIESCSRDGYKEVVSKGSLHRTRYIQDLNSIRNKKRQYDLFRDSGENLLIGEGMYTRGYGVENGYKNFVTQDRMKDAYSARIGADMSEFLLPDGCVTDSEYKDNCDEMKEECHGNHEEIDKDDLKRNGQRFGALSLGRYGILRESPGIPYEGSKFNVMLEATRGNYFTLHGISLGYVQKDQEEYSSGNVIPVAFGKEYKNKVIPK